MNKSELITRMAERLDGDRAAAAAAVNGVLDEIEGSVARGERVSLTGFGTFDRRERASRAGRNPRTGEAIQVGPSVVAVFRPGTGFKSLLAAANGVPVTTASAVADAPAGADEAAARSGKEASKKAGGKASKKASGKASKKAGGKAGKKAGKKASKASGQKPGKKTAAGAR